METIAYIDDNTDCLEAIKFAFEALGYIVDTYDDPIAFYNIDKEYKLIISDFDMPNLNGQEFIKLMKEKDPRIKTIIYSGMVDNIKDLNLDIDTFLSKPVELNSLIKAVKFLIFQYDKENSKAS